MTTAEFAAPPRSAPAVWSASLLWRAAACLSLVALWLVGRPYSGVIHDARLYMGAALARLSPETVGRDMMFALDGQFGFTAFGALADPLVSAFGPSAAALLLTLAGTALWLAAAAALVTRFVKGREAWLVLAAVAVLPAHYGMEDVLRYGESFATPRPFAEAGVLAALAVLLSGRRWAALAPLTFAALFHPVMALTGFGVFFVVLAWEDRRWRLLVPVGALGAVGAAAAGLPIAERLLQGMDPAWFEVLRLRSPMTLLGAWPPESFARVGVHAATALIAAALLQGRTRVVFGSVLAVGLLGLACSAVLGDGLRSVLVLQLQTWRALWLLAVVAAAGLGFCVVRLWPLGWSGRLVLAALALAWTGLDDLLFGPPAAALALAAFACLSRGHTLRVAKAATLCLAAVAALRLLGVEAAWWSASFQGAADRPADLALPRLWWLSYAHVWIVAAVGLVLLAGRRSARPQQAAPVAAVLSIALLLTAAAAWDQRSPVRRASEQASGAADLRRALGAAPGDVFWLGGEIQPWMVADRPGWWSMMQAAPTVFSRDLAMEWRRRHAVLVDAGLAWPISAGSARERREAETRPPPPWTPRKLSALCLRADAPAWVVVPLLEGQPTPAETAALWRSGATEYRLAAPGVLQRLQGYAALPCAVRR